MLVGDWIKIKGQYGNPDRIGYIYEIDLYRVFIVVTSPKLLVKTQADYDKAKVGVYKNITVPLEQYEFNEAELYSLIDLALVWHDKEWFMELTDNLLNKK